jgi:hypothetical protein
MHPKFQKADFASRRKAMSVVIAAALIGSLIIFFFEKHSDSLLNWFFSDPSQLVPRLKFLFMVVAILGASLLIGVAVNLWSLGDQVIDACRFPLEGQKVIRDTPILEGRAAEARGRVYKVLAFFFGLTAIALCFACWLLFRVVIDVVLHRNIS